MTTTARIVAVAVVLLALATPPSARAGDLLGGRLDTSGTWVAVTSKATVDTRVTLTSEGDIVLDQIAFDMAPGERRQVAYTGSGLGYVTARMTPLDVVEGSSGAIELRAWVLYVAPPPKAPLWPWVVLGGLLFIAALFVAAYRKDRSHAPIRA